VDDQIVLMSTYPRLPIACRREILLREKLLDLLVFQYIIRRIRQSLGRDLRRSVMMSFDPFLFLSP